MSYFIYTDLIHYSLLDPRLVNPRLTLIYIGAYAVRHDCFFKISQKILWQLQ